MRPRSGKPSAPVPVVRSVRGARKGSPATAPATDEEGRARREPCRREPGVDDPRPGQGPALDDARSTRERVLAVAGEVFGRLGFKAATVREICRLAGASVAAVNYHFRDKQTLYLTVMSDLMRRGIERYPPDLGLGPERSPEARLRAFIRSALFRLLGEGGWYGAEGSGRLLVRELLDPSPSLDHVVREYLRPLKERLLGIVAEIAGPKVPSEDVERCALSVIGQCMHHAVGTPVIHRLGLAQGREAEAIERLADHIARFSLGGLRQVREAFDSRRSSSPPRRTPSRPEGNPSRAEGGRP